MRRSLTRIRTSHVGRLPPLRLELPLTPTSLLRFCLHKPLSRNRRMVRMILRLTWKDNWSKYGMQPRFPWPLEKLISLQFEPTPGDTPLI
jgi:hypothetical protein